MTQERWTAVDGYLDEVLGLHEDPVLESALQASSAAGLPPIQVSPTQGRLLYLLARLRGARRILEIGTLGGYSAIWLARALPPDGRLVSCEIDPHHAAVARANLARAGLDGVAEVRVGPAVQTLARLSEEGTDPYDLVFIDADKPSNPDYFAGALRLALPGTVVVVDNVVRDGAVVDADSEDAGVQGTRRVLEAMAAEPSVEVTAVQTVGSKGYDGFALALVRGAVAAESAPPPSRAEIGELLDLAE